MFSHHYHFAPEMRFFLFLEPSRCSPHAEVSRFLQLSRHLSWSCASNLCELWHSCHIPALYLFFGFPFFVPSTSLKCSAFTGPLSSSIFSTCPNHRNLCCLKNSSNLSTPVISRIFSLFVLYFVTFPHIICNNLISVVFQLPFIFHFECPTFSTISWSTIRIAFV